VEKGDGVGREAVGGWVYSIRDMGSLNGTIVNGTRISEEKRVSPWVRLNGGDDVLLGKTKLAIFFSVKLPDLPPTKEEQGACPHAGSVSRQGQASPLRHRLPRVFVSSMKALSCAYVRVCVRACVCACE